MALGTGRARPGVGGRGITRGGVTATTRTTNQTRGTFGPCARGPLSCPASFGPLSLSVLGADFSHASIDLHPEARVAPGPWPLLPAAALHFHPNEWHFNSLLGRQACVRPIKRGPCQFCHCHRHRLVPTASLIRVHLTNQVYKGRSVGRKLNKKPPADIESDISRASRGP